MARGLRRGDGVAADRILLEVRAPFVPREGRHVRGQVSPRDEDDARVRVRGGDEAPGVLEEVELEQWDETLEVGLLVDREVQVPVADRPERSDEQVVPARLHAF